MTDRHVQKPYPLRMPEELRERLEEEAARLGRSLHAEIVSRLQESFEAAEKSSRAEIVAIVRATIAELKAAERKR